MDEFLGGTEMKTHMAPEHFELPFSGLKPWMIHFMAFLIVLLLAAAVLVNRLDSHHSGDPIPVPAAPAPVLVR
jgi:hypothetical protein